MKPQNSSSETLNGGIATGYIYTEACVFLHNCLGGFSASSTITGPLHRPPPSCHYGAAEIFLGRPLLGAEADST